jgi:folate-dependent phosphoribosylglycinamide formyltransferase PurN
MDQFDKMLIQAGITPSTEPMNLDFAALAENNSKIIELAETKNLPNIFSTSEDLLTQAQNDENLMKILKKAQSGYMQFLNDNFTLAQMLQAMGIINEQLTQAGYDPINLDLLQ